jgi:hypothetical protein
VATAVVPNVATAVVPNVATAVVPNVSTAVVPNVATAVVSNVATAVVPIDMRFVCRRSCNFVLNARSKASHHYVLVTESLFQEIMALKFLLVLIFTCFIVKMAAVLHFQEKSAWRCVSVLSELQ